MKGLVTFLILFGLALLLGSALTVWAQLPLDTITVWVPEQMILGHEYEGIVIMETATPDGSLVILSSGDDDAIHIQSTVSVPPYQNHGIFKITPKATGTTEVFATIHGKLIRVPTEIYPSNTQSYNLEITPAANKTKADTMLVYLTISDDNGTPVTISRDLPVSITTSESIDAPHGTITIRNGTGQSKFEVDVHASGKITAHADSVATSHAYIEKVFDEYTVKIGVAPDIAMPNSYVFYYIWIEKDGKPFKPPYVVDAFVFSGNHDVGRFTANAQTHKYDGTPVYLVDGIAQGKLYTGNSGGHTDVTVSIPEFGSASDSLFVALQGLMVMILATITKILSSTPLIKIFFYPMMLLAWKLLLFRPKGKSCNGLGLSIGDQSRRLGCCCHISRR